MGRFIDEQLWEAWRRRLARYEQWSGTVAAFCLREDVSAVAFYQWRRKLDGDCAGRRTEPDWYWLYPWGPSVGAEDRLEALRREASS